jgi:hypothetical protein
MPGERHPPSQIPAFEDRPEAEPNGICHIPPQEMFQTCGSAPLAESEETINASEGSDAHPSAALPVLPRE